MKEFNNRKIADKFAEYITGDELRRYVAKKVLLEKKQIVLRD